jgi:hypothetical protein
MTLIPDTAPRRCRRWACQIALISALAVPLSSTNAAAISRYMSTSMTCASIKSAISNEGEVILRYKSQRTGNLLYNRYVRNDNYCRVDQTTQAKSVPASNTNNCVVYYCVKKDRDCNDFFRRC